MLKLKKEQNKENIKPLNLIEVDNERKTRSGKESVKPLQISAKPKLLGENSAKSIE